jgi:hypothetical protein
MPALSRAIGSGRARLGERPSRAQAQARHAVDPACCAPAATGHTTAPPSSVMTSRRLSSGRDARFIARPPPRSARAAFPHAAPTSVYDGESGRIRSSAFVTRAWLWVQYVLCWCAFPLAPALRSTDSAAFAPADASAVGFLRFVRRLHSYYGEVRLLASVHHRLRFLTFPTRTIPLTQRLTARHETSQVPCDPFARDVAFDLGTASAPRIGAAHVAFERMKTLGPCDV